MQSGKRCAKGAMTAKRQRQRAQQGLTLIEIMVVVVIIATFVGGAALVLRPQLEKANIKAAKTDTDAVRSAATLFFAEDPGADCPTVDDLVEQQLLASNKRTADPWGNEFKIECTGGDITVISAGPDEEFGTEDDVE